MVMTRRDLEGKFLYLTLYREYFDQIRSGLKTEEYRDRSKYWIARLRNKCYDFVFFRNGYGRNRPWIICECRGIRELEVRDMFAVSLGKIVAGRGIPA